MVCFVCEFEGEGRRGFWKIIKEKVEEIYDFRMGGV